MTAPAFFARCMTASTSAFDATLWPMVNSVALRLSTGKPESLDRLLRGQMASLRLASKSKKATAPYSNSVPTIPSVLSPRPSRSAGRSERICPGPHFDADAVANTWMRPGDFDSLLVIERFEKVDRDQRAAAVRRRHAKSLFRNHDLVFCSQNSRFEFTALADLSLNPCDDFGGPLFLLGFGKLS